MKMTKQDREKAMAIRKQIIVCDRCGKEVYKPYTFGAMLLCHACHVKAKTASRVHPDQMPLFQL